MKKLILGLLALTLVLSGCGKKEPKPTFPTAVIGTEATEMPTEVPTEIPTTEETAAPTTEETTVPTTEATGTSESTESTEPVGVTGVVAHTASVHLREGPSPFTRIIKDLPEGTPVTVYETAQLNGANWCRSDEGWIALAYLDLDGEAPGLDYDPSEGTPGIIYNTDFVRVRAEPSGNGEVVGELYRNDTVFVTETAMGSGIKWGKIKDGWISMDYVQLRRNNHGATDDMIQNGCPHQWRMDHMVEGHSVEYTMVMCECGEVFQTLQDFYLHRDTYFDPSITDGSSMDGHDGYSVLEIREEWVPDQYIWYCDLCGGSTRTTSPDAP